MEDNVWPLAKLIHIWERSIEKRRSLITMNQARLPVPAACAIPPTQRPHTHAHTPEGSLWLCAPHGLLWIFLLLGTWGRDGPYRLSSWACCAEVPLTMLTSFSFWWAGSSYICYKRHNLLIQKICTTVYHVYEAYVPVVGLYQLKLHVYFVLADFGTQLQFVIL